MAAQLLQVNGKSTHSTKSLKPVTKGGCGLHPEVFGIHSSHGEFKCYKCHQLLMKDIRESKRVVSTPWKMSLQERKDAFDVEYLLCMVNDNADKGTESDLKSEDDSNFDFFVYETQMDALTRKYSKDRVVVATEVGIHDSGGSKSYLGSRRNSFSSVSLEEQMLHDSAKQRIKRLGSS
jgi:hypothetical protein